MKRYISIDMQVMLENEISMHDWALLENIQFMSRNKYHACYAKRTTLAKGLGICTKTLQRMINKLVKNEFIIIDELKNLSVTDKWENLSVHQVDKMSPKEVKMSTDKVDKMSAPTIKKEITKESNKEEHTLSPEIIDATEAQRTVSTFDAFRREIQPNFVRQEFKNIDGAYLLREDCYKTGRTIQMYQDAIRWLFSGDKEAQFFIGYVDNIGALIKNYNKIEMKYITNSKDTRRAEMLKRAVKFYMGQGMTQEQAILEAQK